ncbi:glycosyltransferase [Aurantiacibacter zhengii]|uniref:Glycosyltransferase n=1 Tax=Aurantiacibacter zhengii TaxID=2307003 RepID=A0A418NNJ3_9SPHN|nr:glycosyltransferase [Aurantiacibacter zhengii]RIV83039.1 glycosyltransferase [Aurantiacibacter zhengii]
MNEPPFSVIIPAHNEAAVIGRCLSKLLEGASAEALPEVIIAANGCSDETVAIAREVAPFATVLDLPAGSKVIAMNEGNRLAEAVPRFFLDADILCSYASLAATARVLRRPGVMAASPELRMDLSKCDQWVKSYYKVWLTQPYVRDRLVGSGVYGLSAEGLSKIGEIPATFADDTWVRTRFSYDQRRNVSYDEDGNSVYFTVSPPRTASDLVKIEARRRVGSEQVALLGWGADGEQKRLNSFSDLRTARAEGASVVDLGTYLTLKATALVKYRWRKLRGKAPVWTRDLAARS